MSNSTTQNTRFDILEFYLLQVRNKQNITSMDDDVESLQIMRSLSPPPLRRQKRMWGSLDPTTNSSNKHEIGINLDE